MQLEFDAVSPRSPKFSESGMNYTGLN